MQNFEPVKIEAPSLPESGGSLKGMGESLSAAGPDGAVSFSVPLPVSDGRGAAPALSLNYNSAAGNGSFGMGWSCEPGFISLRTAKGVPEYEGKDVFLGPDGEVLVPYFNAQGIQQQRTASILLGIDLEQSYMVSRWQSRIFSGAQRLEYWQPQKTGEQQPFWVLFTAGGNITLFGFHPQARVADPANQDHIARWLTEETVTPTGEHIYYYWKEENDAGCSEAEIAQHPRSTAQCYLSRIGYGNIEPDSAFISVRSGVPADNTWLFYLVFDYGERSNSLFKIPPYVPQADWSCRPDCFSRYDYGFEVRTRRLCRQVLMFHRLQSMAGVKTEDELPALVSRLTLEYDLNNRAVLLTSIRNLAHNGDGMPVTMAPLEFDYQRFDSDLNLSWQVMPQLGKLNALQPYQLVDLYGEGIPGILYQNTPGAWWYREPLRDSDASNPDAVNYSAATPLPQIPSQQDSAILVDIQGDGKLDWVISADGLRGYHSMSPQREWAPFVPFSAFPLEYFHSNMQLSDMTGDGLPDMALIGPRSVRFWANNRQGWGIASESEVGIAAPLPIPGSNACHLVAFSDIDGSGKSHLIKVTANDVTYWPNLGHGRFAEPLVVPGFSIANETFNPDRLYMADIDGSGTTDLIYARSDCLELFINESGNRFADALQVALPDGVRFDDTCRLQIADIQGLGVGSLILTVPHMAVQHWRLDLVPHKPLLMNAINNNMGADTALFYRSSAQFWLDEKYRLMAMGEKPECYLPFPVHLLYRTRVLDEITKNYLTSHCEYRHGGWDGHEREYRGFGCVIRTDIDVLSTKHDGNTPPARSISWYATGIEEIDKRLAQEYWQGDERALKSFSVRFTRFDMEKETDIPFEPAGDLIYWMNRATKGMLLRAEVYGDDNTDGSSTPYTVNESRLQVRMLSSSIENAPVLMTFNTESCNWVYERVASDPHCSHQILLRTDQNGAILDSVDIVYPRRKKTSLSAYPDVVSEEIFNSSFDEQQALLHLTRTRHAKFSLESEDTWVHGLTDCLQTDARAYPQDILNDEYLSVESLSGLNASLLPGREEDYLGHQRVVYTGKEGKPDYPPLVSYTETAKYDARSLQVFDGVLSADQLKNELHAAGWLEAQAPFTNSSALNIWVGRNGYTSYAGASGFYQPLKQRETMLTGETTFIWDTHYLAVHQTIDAAGRQQTANYDYRFMIPDRIVDENDNVTCLTYDALGRITSSRFGGIENGVNQGYTLPENETQPFVIPNTLQSAADLDTNIPVGAFVVYNSLNWMPPAENEKTGEASAKVATEDGLICRLAARRNGVTFSDTRLPPHTGIIETDRYDSDPEQQRKMKIEFGDGFGRLLYLSVRHEGGECFDVKPDDKGKFHLTGTLSNVDVRWAISARCEYDSKGKIIASYNQFFQPSCVPVSDESLRKYIYSDKHYYDNLGRNTKTITAKGYCRKVFYSPWFVIGEDENDTM